MFIGDAVFEIAGGGALADPSPWYKVWAPKGLVQKGLNRNVTEQNSKL